MGHHATEWHVDNQPRGRLAGSVCRGEGRHCTGKEYVINAVDNLGCIGTVNYLQAICILYGVHVMLATAKVAVCVEDIYGNLHKFEDPLVYGLGNG